MSSLIIYAAITLLTLCGICVLLHPLHLCVKGLMSSAMQKQDLYPGAFSGGHFLSQPHGWLLGL